MEWITELLRAHPELAIYLTLGLGFLIGKIQVKGFSLGVVTTQSHFIKKAFLARSSKECLFRKWAFGAPTWRKGLKLILKFFH